jgi:hypothetical protein
MAAARCPAPSMLVHSALHGRSVTAFLDQIVDLGVA